MLIKMIIGVGITIVMLDASIVIFTMNAIAVKYDSEFGLREKIDYGSYPAGLTIGCQSCLLFWRQITKEVRSMNSLKLTASLNREFIRSGRKATLYLFCVASCQDKVNRKSA